MQLDKTRIAVRERGVFDTLDLALHVCRLHLPALALMMAIGALPWAVINLALTYWMVPLDLDVDSADWLGDYVRFAWTMTALVVLEAPLASAFVTTYMGQALFVEHPDRRQTVRDVCTVLPSLLWCHLVLRGILPALLLVLMIDRQATFSGPEVLLMLLFLAVMLRRTTTPYLNEIILLERNPISSQQPHIITVSRRSAMLHGPAAGRIISMSLATGLYAPALAVGLAVVMLLGQYILLEDFQLHWTMPLLGWPLAMWATAGFMAVVRYLGYLESRIRYEGWEVELRMRAEAARLAEALK